MPDLQPVYRYHDGTKHHFHGFARSLGYLDWASQPHPFRSFAGASTSRLSLAAEPVVRPIPYAGLFQPGSVAPAPAGVIALGDLLRHALGLSAWKRIRDSRWALRVNPSSGNLHPTEAYVIAGPIDGLSDAPSVFHYAADRHALECRCVFDALAWDAACAGSPVVCLIALTSIHWRESWKYGERAFRYCQHDLGHAVAALRLAAALAGWRATLLPECPQRVIAALAGLDREEDYLEAEPEEPACVLAITPGEVPVTLREGCEPLAASVARGRWFGRASQLSEDHVQWTFIDEIARATRDAGRESPATPVEPGPSTSTSPAFLDARTVILQRRSAVAFDGRSPIDGGRFRAILARTIAGPWAPWDALWWTPRIHLVVFVHRVEGLAPGIYAFVRDERALDRLKRAWRADFLWERAGDLPLYCLALADCRALAARVSCDQEIASDGFFSLGMVADFDRSLEEFGPSFYRHLFWESGVVGQVLYLEAEAAGARATGIGCFYDDPVHDILGTAGHAFQSLYHFTIGVPIEDARLTTEPGYPEERRT